MGNALGERSDASGVKGVRRGFSAIRVGGLVLEGVILSGSPSAASTSAWIALTTFFASAMISLSRGQSLRALETKEQGGGGGQGMPMMACSLKLRWCSYFKQAQGAKRKQKSGGGGSHRFVTGATQMGHI
jgi:hypothetical protein